ncbi:RNA ligase protein REL/rnl2 [Fadolivirus algeromassiliense]|uniref:RNA ligase protein REL/rnl2 n=1 Tax=Fadolivirus FV1/VV64 TaxID=3070911 RepID=A0A7D3UUH9_9VIRU|nr:RNA ligase protein REL/rnl2 [Fadolivirus algeromassiliense]QKF93489.1 RNA ligase protein REL/rnl2 [Fadolivirus FV1/VV64]
MEQVAVTTPIIKHRTFHHIVNAKVSSFVKKFNGNSMVIVEEKVDGSNFYFASNGIDSICGRKHDILHESAKFYDFQKILHLKQNIIELHKKLNIRDAVIYLYGELIPTQKRITYVPDGEVRFIAFNLRIVPFHENDDDAGSTVWLHKDQWEKEATECGFIVNPTIFKGTLQECLEFDVENTKSVIPQLLNSNTTLVSIIEGVVIKGLGFTMKKKAHAFREMESGGGIKFGKTKDPNETAVGELLGSMLTISRLENIVSQIGDQMVPDAHRLSNTVVLDAIQEARDDDDCVIHLISKSKVSKIQKELAVVFMDQVKEHMGW